MGRGPAARGALPGRHPDPERFVAEFSGSDRTVAEYLIAEMLEHQPADVQDLLLCTSLLDRVNGELADLLTGRAGSEQVLLVSRTRTRWSSRSTRAHLVRYHHLFADLLRLELRRTQPEKVPCCTGSPPAGSARGPARQRHPAHPGAGDWLKRPGCSPTTRSA